jgi:(S)-ureidoglycine aminohydrolase
MMMAESYVPTQADILSRSRAVVKPGLYMILPQTNRVASGLPSFEKTIVQVLATPEAGAEFVEHELILEPGGGTVKPIQDGLEHFCFVLEGNLHLDIAGDIRHDLEEGGFAYLPVGTVFGLKNPNDKKNRVLWIKRRYKPIGFLKPDPIIGNEKNVSGTPGQYLIPYKENLAYDMSMLIVNLDPGKGLSQVEIHIMEHGLYMLQGQGIYWLSGDYHEVQTNDFIYMAPYCPQYFYVTGQSMGRYLLYKDVNRDYDEKL